MTIAQRQNRRTRRGFSLIEAAIVLAVVGLVIGGLWWAASAVSESRKASEAVKGTLFTLNDARRLFPAWVIAATIPGAGTFGNPAVFVGAGVYLADWVNSGSAYHPWGGTFYVVLRRTAILNPKLLIDINFEPPLPPSACINLITRLSANYMDRTELDEVKVTGSATTLLVSFPVSTTAAQTACAAAGSNIYLSFRYHP